MKFSASSLRRFTSKVIVVGGQGFHLKVNRATPMLSALCACSMSLDSDDVHHVIGVILAKSVQGLACQRSK
jgi:hypothetical protein